MSEFITELRYLPKEHYDLAMSAYPIFDEVYRPTLNTIIYNRFYFHEIGFESVDRFFFELANVMREIMPLYNQFYGAELLEYDPFEEFNKELNQTMTDKENVFDKMVETLLEKGNGSSKSKSNDSTDETADTKTKSIVEQNDSSDTLNKDVRSSNDNTQNNSTNNSKGVGSKTPGKLLSIGTIENNVYASDANIDESKVETTNVNNSNSENKIEESVNSKSFNESNADSNNTTNKTSESTVEVENDNTKFNENEKKNEKESSKSSENVSRETGHNQSKTKLLIELRESFINIDMMILENKNLNECFLQIY